MGIPRARRLALLLVVTAVVPVANGCEPWHEDDATSPPTSAPSDDATATSCAGDPEALAARALAERDLRRDGCQAPTFDEDQACTQQAGMLLNVGRIDAVADVIALDRARAGIAADVPISVTADLQPSANLIGGVTSHLEVVLDGKVLEILSDVAVLDARREAGVIDLATYLATVDQVVLEHARIVGMTAPPVVAPTAFEVAAASAIFADLLAVGMFHEFGHYWTWSCIDQRRMASPAGAWFFYPAKIEDDADLVAGLLSAKAGVASARIDEAFDLMSCFMMMRAGQIASCVDVESAYVQFLTSSEKYSSLAMRKALAHHGEDLWRRFGADVVTPVTPPGSPTCGDGICEPGEDGICVTDCFQPPPASQWECGGNTYICQDPTDVHACIDGIFAECPALAPIWCCGGCFTAPQSGACGCYDLGGRSCQ